MVLGRFPRWFLFEDLDALAITVDGWFPKRAADALDWGGLSRDQAANRIHKFISSTQDEHGEVHLACGVSPFAVIKSRVEQGFLGDKILPSKKKGIIS